MAKIREIRIHRRELDGVLREITWIILGDHELNVVARRGADGNYCVRVTRLVTYEFIDPAFFVSDCASALLVGLDIVQQLRRLPDTAGGCRAGADVVSLMAWCYMDELDRRMWWFGRHASADMKPMPKDCRVTRAGLKQRKRYGKTLNRKQVKRECMEYLNEWRKQ